MGENAVPQKCGNNAYPETDRTKNVQNSQSFLIISTMNGFFLQKDWHKIGIFVNCFLNVAVYVKRPIVPHLLTATVYSSKFAYRVQPGGRRC